MKSHERGFLLTVDYFRKYYYYHAHHSVEAPSSLRLHSSSEEAVGGAARAWRVAGVLAMLASAPHGVTLSPHAPPYPRTPSSQPKPWTLAALGAAAAWRAMRRSACSSRLSACCSPRASCSE